MTPMASRPAHTLTGVARVPGDKSISHRALLIGALSTEETVIEGLLEGEDVLRTAAAIRALGATAERSTDSVWRVRGRGLGGLVEPADILDMGNSGTAARLLMGILASHPLTAFLTGDASLNRRPMGRVRGPLEQFGAQLITRSADRMPLAIIGTADPVPVRYRLPVASAQVKSAVLLAGLNTPGVTTVIEQQPTRDHTERMLRHFGADVESVEADEGAWEISVAGQPELRGRPVQVPADISSAAFPMVAALIVPGSEVTLTDVGINPLRTGLVHTLREMGADIEMRNERTFAGEPVADLFVRAGRLAGVTVPASRAPSMIDEYPILAIAAAVAEGKTEMRGLAELRVKESDRLGAMARGLAACGVSIEEGDDSLTVHGCAGNVPGGGNIATDLDHRVAMAFLVLGLASDRAVVVDDADPIDTSFPGFIALMNRLGARIGPLTEVGS
ncbi:MAG: 3-phosphoshikimate 1-carboxyvinyltransferase [Rhodospirillales bacterium]|nr:MAG: 3-phosphoshikimate 1-carboxyvinyltransferase [Rhodospirillales bacterium]